MLAASDDVQLGYFACLCDLGVVLSAQEDILVDLSQVPKHERVSEGLPTLGFRRLRPGVYHMLRREAPRWFSALACSSPTEEVTVHEKRPSPLDVGREVQTEHCPYDLWNPSKNEGVRSETNKLRRTRKFTFLPGKTIIQGGEVVEGRCLYEVFGGEPGHKRLCPSPQSPDRGLSSYSVHPPGTPTLDETDGELYTYPGMVDFEYIDLEDSAAETTVDLWDSGDWKDLPASEADDTFAYFPSPIPDSLV